MVTTRQRRKTDKMLLVELANGGTPIDQLMLKAIRQAEGIFADAARSVDLSKATFTKWLVALGIDGEAQTIREYYGKTVTHPFLDEPAKERRTRRSFFEMLESACKECGMSVGELPQPIMMVDSKSSLVGQVYTLQDGRGERHTFGQAAT